MSRRSASRSRTGEPPPVSPLPPSGSPAAAARDARPAPVSSPKPGRTREAPSAAEEALAALPEDKPRPPGPELAALPRGDLPLARVNGIDLTPARIFPPTVMGEGDQMPKAALDKFIDDAVDQAVVVQEAERRGYAQDPQFLKLMDDLRRDLAGLPNTTEAEREWQWQELRDRALMERVYQEEGIVPVKVSEEEIEAYSQAHPEEYEWVRKRETLKGGTEERIQRRIREEVRKDLTLPRKRDLMEKRQAFTAGLRARAKIERLAEPLPSP